jgi:outer membrane protein assembly factor BamB
MSTRVPRTGFSLLAFGVWLSSLAADNWPQWRGPDGVGISHETGLPAQWGPEHNIAWKAEPAAWGASTPVIWGDRIFLTGQIGRGPLQSGSKEGEVTQREAEPLTFIIQCLGRADGRELWRHSFKAEGYLQPANKMHNLASPSCVTDGERVIAWFGTGQLLCLSMGGKVLWQRHLGTENSRFELMWAHGSSPALHGKLLYLLCDHHPAAYLLALDKETGKDVWKTDRGKELRSYTTPLLIQVGERQELIINSNPGIDAYDPETGKRLWRVSGHCKVPVPTPVFSDGVLYTNRGYRNGPYLAVRAGGTGDVTDSHVLWQVQTGAPYVASPLYYQGLLYLVSEMGTVRCVVPETGETVWLEKPGVNFWASPVGADGKVYLLAENGDTLVLRPGRKFELLARNSLGEDCLASPAISQGRIFIRSSKHLFCIGQ